MMNIQDRKAKLNVLLQRVQKNRVLVASNRVEAIEPAGAPIQAEAEALKEPIAPQKPTHGWVMPIRPELETPVAVVEKTPVPLVEEMPLVEEPPVAVVEEPPVAVVEEPVEVKTFESAPIVSADVAQFKGETPKSWTLASVLKRAWNLGASK